MNSALARTRVVKPRRRPDLLSRQRLLKLLYDQLYYKLLIVVAPAGYGKTSLLIDFADQIDQAVCWYSVDILDQNPTRFFAHFLASITHKFDSFGVESQAALQEIMESNSSLEQLVPVIVNELYDQVQDPFTLVIDDYHVVSDVSEIQNFLNAFIQQVDDGCQVVLASRRLLSLPDLPLLVARSLVGGISLEDLAFQTDEIQAMMAQNSSRRIDDDTALEIVEETEGWITGILLSDQIHQNKSTGSSRLMGAAGVGLYDYLAQQVFEQQEPAIQKFLLHTSLLEEFNDDFCREILGTTVYSTDADWHKLIEIVVSNNLFILTTGSDELWYRYHNLFQEFLLRRVHKELPVEETAILDSLASLYIKRQQWEKARQIRQRQGNVEQIADVVEMAIPILDQNYQRALLEGWLNELPEQLYHSRPFLAAIQGKIQVYQGENKFGRSLLEKAIKDLSSNSSRVQLAIALTWLATIQREAGELETAGTNAKKAHDILEESRSDALGNSNVHRIYQAQALNTQGVIYALMGQTEQAAEHLTQSLSLYSEIGTNARAAIVINDLANVNMNAGRYVEALSQLHRALDRIGTHSQISIKALILNNIGVLYHLSGDYINAHRYLQQAVQFARQVNNLFNNALSLASLGDLFVDIDEADVAQQSYQEAFEIADQINFKDVLLHIELARAQVACGKKQWAMAFTCLDKAGQLVLSHRHQPNWNLYKMVMGRFYLERDDYQRAADELNEAVLGYVKSSQPAEEAIARLLLACAHWRLNQSISTYQELTQTASIVNELHIWHPLVTKANAFKDVLQEISRTIEQNSSSNRYFDSQKQKRVSKNILSNFCRELLARTDCLEQTLAEIREYVRQFPDEKYEHTQIALPTKEQELTTYISEHQAGVNSLTKRELEILRLIAQQHSNQDIAETLSISLKTVKKHIYNLYQKLGVHRRLEAVLRAQSLNLL